MYTAHISDPLTILITQYIYIFPHNHPYISRYLRLAATYVGMVMWDDEGCDNIITCLHIVFTTAILTWFRFP